MQQLDLFLFLYDIDTKETKYMYCLLARMQLKIMTDVHMAQLHKHEIHSQICQFRKFQSGNFGMPGKCNWFSLVGIGITTKMFPI
jgi:hypothetical protein